MSEPTETCFVYNRAHPPLFFLQPSIADADHWERTASSITREYYRLARYNPVNPRTPLSNGMTAGEYAMWLILTNHQKRRKPS